MNNRKIISNSKNDIGSKGEAYILTNTGEISFNELFKTLTRLQMNIWSGIPNKDKNDKRKINRYIGDTKKNKGIDSKEISE